MIRYKDKVYEDYFIDEKTAVITDKNGKVKHQCFKVKRKYAFVFIDNIQMYVHIIQAQTKHGYRLGNIVHHIDGNSLNNALSNLDYDHDQSWHLNKEHKPWKNKKGDAKCSEETKRKISKANKGKTPWNKGKTSKALPSRKNKSYNLTEEMRQKRSAITKGKHLSEETRKKISETMKKMAKTIKQI